MRVSWRYNSEGWTRCVRERMTCYAALETGSAPGSPMAHHLVKWWRNKFRNGYKKFSMGVEGERTDTEELVGRAASQCSAPPDLLPSSALRAPPTPRRDTPPAAPQPPPRDEPAHAAPRLRFEELTCDVQVQDDSPQGQQPLQFSFTLYDFDGHGRMTKDDIAGIVSTIYDSVGKSVKVPHYGSKTIQVRLTVVPEARGGAGEEAGRRRRARRRLSTEHSEEASEWSRAPRRTRAPPRPAAPRAPRAPHQRRAASHAAPPRKRSSSLQRQELLEIIQANMEKNHMSFQTARKPTEYRVAEEAQTPLAKPHHRHRSRAFTLTEKPAAEVARARDRPDPLATSGYLDLAHHDRLAATDSNLCRYDRYLHAVICSSAKHATSGYHQKNPPTVAPKLQKLTKTHYRSRSHDLPQRLTQVEPRVLQIIFL